MFSHDFPYAPAFSICALACSDWRHRFAFLFHFFFSLARPNLLRNRIVIRMGCEENWKSFRERNRWKSYGDSITSASAWRHEAGEDEDEKGEARNLDADLQSSFPSKTRLFNLRKNTSSKCNPCGGDVNALFPPRCEKYKSHENGSLNNHQFA